MPWLALPMNINDGHFFFFSSSICNAEGNDTERKTLWRFHIFVLKIVQWKLYCDRFCSLFFQFFVCFAYLLFSPQWKCAVTNLSTLIKLDDFLCCCWFDSEVCKVTTKRKKSECCRPQTICLLTQNGFVSFWIADVIYENILFRIFRHWRIHMIMCSDLLLLTMVSALFFSLSISSSSLFWKNESFSIKTNLKFSGIRFYFICRKDIWVPFRFIWLFSISPFE